MDINLGRSGARWEILFLCPWTLEQEQSQGEGTHNLFSTWRPIDWCAARRPAKGAIDFVFKSHRIGHFVAHFRATTWLYKLYIRSLLKFLLCFKVDSLDGTVFHQPLCLWIFPQFLALYFYPMLILAFLNYRHDSVESILTNLESLFLRYCADWPVDKG